VRRQTDQGAATVGGPGRFLAEDEVRAFVAEQLGEVDLDGRSLLLVVPDATRSAPMPVLLAALHAAAHPRVSRITVLVALGTHQAMTPRQLAEHLGYRPGRLAATYPGTQVVNHAWWDPSSLQSVGAVPPDRVAELSGGLLRRPVAVAVNRAVLEHDVAVLVGPVFPHEVVGFSGGNKYLFPGVASREVIDVSHWLGALLTSAALIGTPGTTPVRALIDDAAALVPGRRYALCVVTSGDGLHAATFGEPRAAWAAAVPVSAATHVAYLPEVVPSVVAVVPARYPDLWTGAKGFYKVEPVVADGGEVVLYAPHIREVSATHPLVEQIGYHCRDYFLQQWDRFAAVPWAELAHSTHLRGAGSYDPVTGEHARVSVTLATGIPRATVEAVGLDYRDPAAVDLVAAAADPATLLVPDAGETLFRLATDRPG